MPELYNQLKLTFLRLCQYIDKFSPQNKILIILDQLHDIPRLRFDWLPIHLPKSIRVVMTHRSFINSRQKHMSDVGTKLDEFITPLLPLKTIDLNELDVYSRKELFRHRLFESCHRQDRRDLTIGQMDSSVLKDDAGSFDYLQLLCLNVQTLSHSRRHTQAVINHLPGKLSGLVNHIMNEAEEYCGHELTKRAASLLVTAMDGLTEIEMLVLLAQVGRSDVIKKRLVEDEPAKVLTNPGTPYVDLQERLKKPRATLPYGLWAPLLMMLKPYMRLTDKNVHDSLMFFVIRKFADTVIDRYVIYVLLPISHCKLRTL